MQWVEKQVFSLWDSYNIASLMYVIVSLCGQNVCLIMQIDFFSLLFTISSPVALFNYSKFKFLPLKLSFLFSVSMHISIVLQQWVILQHIKAMFNLFCVHYFDHYEFFFTLTRHQIASFHCWCATLKVLESLLFFFLSLELVQCQNEYVQLSF